MWGYCNKQCQVCYQITDTCRYISCRGNNCYSVLCKKCKETYKLPIMMTRCSICEKVCCYMYHFCDYYSKCIYCSQFISGRICKDCSKEITHKRCKKSLSNILNIPDDMLDIILTFLE